VTPRRGLVLLCVALSLVVSGCLGGGDDSSSSSSDGRLSREELTRRADAACTAAAQRIKSLRSPTSLEDLAGYANRVQRIGAQLEKTISGLRAAPADARRLLPYRSALRGANEAAHELARAAQRGDRGLVRSAADRIASADLGALAAQAGLARCATAGTFSGSA
jgi:hypothetical protein